MNERLLWFELKSIPISFIKAKLERGLSLSKIALRDYDLLRKIKNAFSLIPSDIEYERIIDFEIGELVSMDKTAEELFNYLDKINGKCIVFENWMVSRSDPALKNIKVPHFYNEEEVYYYYNTNLSDLELFLNILREADRYPLLAWIVKMEELDTLNPNIFEGIINNTEEVIIGCYDEESYMRITV